MSRLIEQHIPMEMRYRPTVVYEPHELPPFNTVFLDAHGRMGTASVPTHLKHLTDPRRLDEFNPDPNAQAVDLVNKMAALDGPSRPTVIRKIEGQVRRVVFPDHERSPALSRNRRSIEDIRRVRQNNAPIQSASLADLHDAFEPGRAGLDERVAGKLQARFQKHPHAAQGMAAVARRRKAAENIDPVTGIKFEAIHRMHPAMRQRLLDAKSHHHGAKAPIIFHPKKTGYKTPNMAGYRGPTRNLTPDVRLSGIASHVPGTGPSEVFNSAASSYVDRLPVASATGQGKQELERLIHNGRIAAASQYESLARDQEHTHSIPEEREREIERELEKHGAHVHAAANGTVSHVFDDRNDEQYDEQYVADVGMRCGWKCWVLAALTVGGIGAGIYTLRKG